MAALIAAPNPTLWCISMMVIPGKLPSFTRPLPLLSTTITSKSACVCARRERRHSAKVSPAARVGITTVATRLGKLLFLHDRNLTFVHRHDFFQKAVRDHLAMVEP